MLGADFEPDWWFFRIIENLRGRKTGGDSSRSPLTEPD